MSTTKSDIGKKIAELASKNPPSNWREKLEYKRQNRAWLKKSFNVAITILNVLDERNMSQTDLADAMKVTRQHVSKILKGQENLTLETVSKLEVVLGIKLGRVLDGEELEPIKSIVVEYSNDLEFDIIPKLNVNVLRKTFASKAWTKETQEHGQQVDEYYARENDYAIAS
jgi:transcriptional regulator with XRE-family HTH domain